MSNILYFLWIDQIKGNSKDPRHLGDFDVRLAYQIAGQPFRHFQAGLGGLIVEIQNIHTPEFVWLHAAASKGRVVSSAIFTIEKNWRGRSAGELARYTMKAVELGVRFNALDERKDKTGAIAIELRFNTLEHYVNTSA